MERGQSSRAVGLTGSSTPNDNQKSASSFPEDIAVCSADLTSGSTQVGQLKPVSAICCEGSGALTRCVRKARLGSPGDGPEASYLGRRTTVCGLNGVKMYETNKISFINQVEFQRPVFPE